MIRHFLCPETEREQLLTDGSWQETVDSLQELYAVDSLQELYAQFDYRDDMSSCSVYSNDGVDPVEAMKNLVCSLTTRFGVEPAGRQ